MDAFFGDLRSILRGLLARAGFSLGVVTTVALGIGANTALFSLVNGILLRPLPYRDPDALVTLYSSGPQARARSLLDPRLSSTSDPSAPGPSPESGPGAGGAPTSTSDGEAELLQGVYTTPGTARAPRVEPALGRLPLPEEERLGRPSASCCWATDCGSAVSAPIHRRLDASSP